MDSAKKTFESCIIKSIEENRLEIHEFVKNVLTKFPTEIPFQILLYSFLKMQQMAQTDRQTDSTQILPPLA